MLIDTNELLSLLEAAKRSGYLTESAIRGRIRRGEIEPIRIGNAVFITIAQLEELLKREGVK